MRRADREKLDKIYEAVKREPGIKAGRIASKLEIPRSSVTRVLPVMEEQGLLLSEDGRGGLWPWGRRK